MNADLGVGMQGTSYYAPAERETLEACRSERENLLSFQSVHSLLGGITDPALVLNDKRQVLAANHRAVAMAAADKDLQLLGQRPGEILRCVHRGDGPAGCGTGPSCGFCGTTAAILAAQEQDEEAIHDSRMAYEGAAYGGALDLRVFARPLRLNGSRFTLLSLRDAAAERRRDVLERMLCSEVLEAAEGVRGLAETVIGEADTRLGRECGGEIADRVEQLAKEIRAYHQLVQAEHGELQLEVREVDTAQLLDEVAAAYRRHSVNVGQPIIVVTDGRCRVRTDPRLLRHVLENLLRNAVEASERGDEIRCHAGELWPGRVIISIHNRQAMGESVQRQIFHRSFSTKPEQGRGIGTYSARLLAERYLGARLSFTSRVGHGTTFRVDLPVRIGEM